MTDDRGREESEPLDRERVAAVLARVKAGAKQRRAERATVPASSEEARLALLELRRAEFVREPVAVSPRPVIGRLLVLVRKVSYHLFVKWHARAVLAQQNAFNQAAGKLIEELLQSQTALTEEVRRLSRRLAEAEGAAPAAEGSSGEGPSGEGRPPEAGAPGAGR